MKWQILRGVMRYFLPAGLFCVYDARNLCWGLGMQPVRLCVLYLKEGK